jgi:hypothetical protein
MRDGERLLLTFAEITLFDRNQRINSSMIELQWALWRRNKKYSEFLKAVVEAFLLLRA